MLIPGPTRVSSSCSSAAKKRTPTTKLATIRQVGKSVINRFQDVFERFRGTWVRKKREKRQRHSHDSAKQYSFASVLGAIGVEDFARKTHDFEAGTFSRRVGPVFDDWCQPTLPPVPREGQQDSQESWCIKQRFCDGDPSGLPNVTRAT